MENSAALLEQVSLGLEDCKRIARAVGLRYVSDQKAGIQRRKAQTGFRYIDIDGKPIRDEEVLKRIKSLVIPPAWTDVWICPLKNGHIQATGRDAKGRKQYRYHHDWRRVRDETKYEHMIAFAKALPVIHKQVEKDLGLNGLPRQKVIAAAVKLLEKTLIRIGNEEYARNNKSFGLTTLRDKHVQIDKGHLLFRFRGKSGKFHDIELNDARLAKIVQRCKDIPGQELFQYIDENGDAHVIGSADVNDYLRSATGEDYTAKDFRTWAGTMLAALALQEFNKFDAKADAKKNVVRAIEMVAQRLGNTPAICKKCYIHPAIIESYLDGSMLKTLKCRTEKALRKDIHSLSPEEAAVLAFLQERLQREVGN